MTQFNVLETLEEMREFYRDSSPSLQSFADKTKVSKATIHRFTMGQDITLANFEKLFVFYQMYQDNVEKLLLELLKEN